MGIYWTTYRLDRLRELWDAGHTGKAIARDLGLHRAGAIFERVKREGLTPRFLKSKPQHDIRQSNGKFTHDTKRHLAAQRYARALAVPPVTGPVWPLIKAQLKAIKTKRGAATC